MDDSFKTMYKSQFDDLKRFEVVESYLDHLGGGGCACDGLLEDILTDDCDIIRSELMDHLIVYGGVSGEVLTRRLKFENSIIVYPRIWLAIAMSEEGDFGAVAELIDEKELSEYERIYYLAGMYVETKGKFFLYQLLSYLFSEDNNISYTCVDLVVIVSGDNINLLYIALNDLRDSGCQVFEKAVNVFKFNESDDLQWRGD